MRSSSSTPARPSSRLLPLFLLFIGGALLGLSSNLAKQAGEARLEPFAFLTWSIVGATAILLLVAAWRRSLPPMQSYTVRYYFIAAFVGVVGSNFIFFAAIPHVGASFVALMITLPPLLTYVGALILRMEAFQFIRAVGVMSALTGAAVLAAKQLAAPEANVFWTLLVLLGPVLLAIGNIYRTLRWPAGVSAQALAPGMLIAATLMLLLAALLPGQSLALPPDGSQAVALIVMQAFVFAAQFHILFLLQKIGGPVLLSLLGSVGAVIAVPVAIYLQNEAPPPGLFTSVALIAIGVGLVACGQAKATARGSAKPKPVVASR